MFVINAGWYKPKDIDAEVVLRMHMYLVHPSWLKHAKDYVIKL